MIIIINGSVGIGKTSLSWALNERLDLSVMLDGDYMGAVNPFEIYDDQRTAHLYKTLLMLIRFQKDHGYNHFVINYVFESPDQLAQLTEPLKRIDPQVHCFWITADPSEHEKRIQERNSEDLKWELKRFVELNGILEKANETGFIGTPFDTDGLSATESAEKILQQLKSSL